MAQFPANIDLFSLDGSNGFRLSGAAFYDRSGHSVASAGDVNGDGFSDLIVGAPTAGPNGGASYVVFGKASGFSANLDLSSLDGANGFKLTGEVPVDTRSGHTGFSVASAGDINGDGFADVIVGTPGIGQLPYGPGASHVVFGQASGFAPNLDLSTLDGSNGFKLSGVEAADRTGHSVASAGDVNGDGFADLIVGAPQGGPDFPPTGIARGVSYVVFGKASGFSANLELSSLDGGNGFKLTGIKGTSGASVASAGDVNGDGFADLIVGALHDYTDPAHTGISYVVFGKASGFAANIELSSLDGGNGFKLRGEAPFDFSGTSVSSAGDVNGDGFADLIIGADGRDFPYNRWGGGHAYVVFGKAGGFDADISLSSLDGTNGFRLSGEPLGGAVIGSSVSAGDVNGDGFSDVIVGTAAPGSGFNYVVFGKASGFAADIDVLSLDGDDGFKLSNSSPDLQGPNHQATVSSAGDVNGDGFGDLIVGNQDANFNRGHSFVVFGRAPDTAVNRTGSAAAQTLAGGAFDDTLSALGGHDRLYGHGGNDMLDGGAGTDTLLGGTGDDIYVVNAGTDLTVENTNEGIDRVQSTIGFTLQANVEHLTLLGIGNTVGTGNTLANAIEGNSGNNQLRGQNGNDTLDGATGVDTLTGGAGDDLYILNDDDVVTEAANAGSDTVRSTLDSTLSANVENLALLGAATQGTGNASANLIVGNTLANTLSGDADNDTLNGGVGNDTLDGGAGNDSLDGGVGTDRLAGDSGDDLYILTDADVVTEGTDAGTDTVHSPFTYTLGANVENLVLAGDATQGTGNTLANALTGNTLGNTLTGAAGSDTLDGGTGVDTLQGGDGDDLYILTDADVVSEGADAGTDTVQSSFTYTLGANVENVVLTGNATRGTGNTLANALTGNTHANTLAGAAGNDTLDGGTGVDTLQGGDDDDLYVLTDADVVTEGADAGTDTVQSAITHTLGANVENLVLTGNAARGAGNTLANALTGNTRANTLSGAAGNDTLNGGTGNDTLQGGDDDDLYILTGADLVTESTDAGTDTVQSFVTHTLGANVENLVLAGGATQGTGNTLGNALTGNTLGNTLSGDAGNDTLDGGTGVDTLQGGGDDDLYILTDADVVSESANAGSDTVQSAFTYTLGANVENLVLAGDATQGTGNTLGNALTGNALGNTLTGDAGNDTLGGGTGNDTLNGGAGNDSLDGGSGADSLVGDSGNDLYILTDAGDAVTESVNAGIDTVQSAVTYTLGANVENLVLTGNATRGTGNTLENALTGNTRANTLSGDDGNDTLNGGAGNDSLDGGSGTDSLVGDIGNDLYILTDADAVTEGADAGTDTVQSSVAHTLAANVENLVLTGNATRGAGNTLANEITGNTRANTLSGDAGNDTLNGGAGNDSLDGGSGTDGLVGGSGDDLYILTDADVVTEDANAGTDTVRSAFTYTLGANVENLVLVGNATRGTGNTLANEITGNTRANVLAGDAGNDTLNGGTGNDTLDGGAGTDSLVGDSGDDLYILTGADVVSESANAGTDTVQSGFTYTLGGNVENLVLTGNATKGTGNTQANALTGNTRANTLVGGDGNDTLAGGLGNDTLTGGAGNDRFLFDTALNGASNVDSISDFDPVTDALRLDDVVFTGFPLGTLASSAFRSGTAAQDASDRIIYNPETGAVRFDSDGTGTAAAVRFATLGAGLAITNSDFIVV